MRRIFCIFLALSCLILPARAAEPAWRGSARLLRDQPEAFAPGRCLAYHEGGAGWIITEPTYHLQGEVIDSAVRLRHLGVCPLVPGKGFEHYSREEFNRQALASPCVSPGVPERDEKIGLVRLRVTDWETPHAKKTENAGRLYRGKFIDKELRKNMELELEADLLGDCE